MLRLLRILRDRGSITAEEYDELRLSAEAPETGAHLADEPRPHEELVGDGLGVRGIVPQGREEQL